MTHNTLPFKIAFAQFKKFAHCPFNTWRKGTKIHKFLFFCNTYTFFKRRLGAYYGPRYAYLTAIFFKKFSILRNPRYKLRVEKFYTSATQLLNSAAITLTMHDFNNNKFEFHTPIFLQQQHACKIPQQAAMSLLIANWKNNEKTKRYAFSMSAFNSKQPSLTNGVRTSLVIFQKTLFFCSNVLFKIFYLFNNAKGSNITKLAKTVYPFARQFFYYSHNHDFFLTNVNQRVKLTTILKKKVIKIFSFNKFSNSSINWHHNFLIRFFERCAGQKALCRFYFFLENLLTSTENMRCMLWSQKLQSFHRGIGNGFFLTESIRIILISIKLKDPYFLINWMRQTLQKISFWKYRTFFHYLKYVFKYFFYPIFAELKIKGVKFKLKGKVSVAGNARTRSVICQVGHVSHATYENKILHSFDLVKTFTGVIGLQIWMVF